LEIGGVAVPDPAEISFVGDDRQWGGAEVVRIRPHGRFQAVLELACHPQQLAAHENDGGVRGAEMFAGAIEIGPILSVTARSCTRLPGKPL
jgi:hypothetical protein